MDTAARLVSIPVGFLGVETLMGQCKQAAAGLVMETGWLSIRLVWACLGNPQACRKYTNIGNGSVISVLGPCMDSFILLVQGEIINKVH